MNRRLQLLTFAVFAAVAALPLIDITGGGLFGLFNAQVTAALNLFGWSLVLVLLVSRNDFRQKLEKAAERLGVETRFKSAEDSLEIVINEIDRKNGALSTNLVERSISSSEELSQALERIATMSFRLLRAESAELALFDRESGLYHSSLVLGKPFQTSAQAMLSGAVDGEGTSPPSPDVLIQPIAFAGKVQGTLRVGLRRGAVPSLGDREIMRLLALQSSVAIVNAEYTRELMRMKEVSEESVKAKTGFLANLSHELRGPLGIMLNAVELVLDGLCGQITEDQLETLSMVKSNGAHLLELINDVLDYAKVEAGKMTVNKVDISVNDLLEDIVKVVRGQAESKRHRLQYSPHGELLTVGCDRRHARQIMINLLTNAIKYTPDGGVIEVWAERLPGNKVRINVRDTGVGIDRADRAKVFSAFERVDHAYSRNQTGSGLGMPLTKRLVEANGGSIDFDSTPREGSHFWIVFDAQLPSPPLSSVSNGHEAPVHGKGRVLLIVAEDNHERQMMDRYLGHVGFKVLLAGSRREALTMVQGVGVEAVILDYNSLDAPVESVVRNLREGGKSAILPIVLVSSHAFVFDIEKYLKAGIDRCLVKPVQFAELGKTCIELLRSERSAAAETKSGQTGDRKSSSAKHRIPASDIYH